MSTALQEDLAEAIVRNKSLPRYKRKNKQDLVVSVGYSAKVASKKASEIINAKGVQESLSKTGLTRELITQALVYDIENKPKRREREIRLGAEILGMTDKSAIANSTTNNFTQIIIHSAKDAKDTGHIPNS